MAGVNRNWVAGVVMVVAAMVVMTKGERVVECEEEEVNKMQDNFINCTQHFKQEYNVQVSNICWLPLFACLRLMIITLMEKHNKVDRSSFYSIAIGLFTKHNQSHFKC